MFNMLFPKHWSTLKKLIWLKAAALSSAVQKTVTAAIVHIRDALAGPAQNVTIAIEPVQAGTGDPSPDNVRPITGWTGANVTHTGKNLFDWSAFYSTAFKRRCSADIAADGTITVTATEDGGAWIGISQNVGETIPSNAFTVKAKKGMTFVCGSLGRNITFYEIDRNGRLLSSNNVNFGTSYTVANDDCVAIGFRLQIANTMTTGETVSGKFQLEIGSTSTAYEAYQGTTYSISFPDSAGTVYGGTLDVTNGVLTVEWTRVHLGGLSWSKNGVRFDSGYLNDAFNFSYGNKSILCECYKAIPNMSGSGFNGDANNLEICFNSSAGRPYLMVKDSAYSDGTALKTSLDGRYAILKRKDSEVQTYQLTPQEVQLLLGENNLWADTGDTTLTYMADGRASDIEALSILLAGRYVNHGAADEATDAEALDILLGGNR